MHAFLILALTGAGALVVAEVIDVGFLVADRVRPHRVVSALRVSCRKPLAMTLLSVSLLVEVEHIGLARRVELLWRHGFVIASLCSAAWLIVKVAFVAEDVAFGRLNIDVRDNRRARRHRTQIRLLRRLTASVVTGVAAASVLLSLPGLGGIGASLLASAGLLSVVAGLAAQSTLGNVFAGIQIAFTDSLRLGDVIVAESEWGRVEEITLSYVVLALWDERRLVLPTSWFTKNPFQNWTRTESRVLGEVILHLDYAVPVGELREEAGRIVNASPLWDRKAWVLQVVDTTPTTMVVRVLASAEDAPSAFDLRCEIREKLLGWLQGNHPQGLPHVRVVNAGAEPYDPFPTKRSVDVTEPGLGRSVFSSG